MRYVTFATGEAPTIHRLGALVEEGVLNLAAASSWAQEARSLATEQAPATLLELINRGPGAWAYSHQVVASVEGEDPQSLESPGGEKLAWELDQVRLLPPLPRPMGLREFSCFEQHIVNTQAQKGEGVPQAWYEMPAFYFSNPNSAFGPEEIVPVPAGSQALDYELEIGCVIGQPGRNIPAARAGAFIFGYTVFNDWSARDLQWAEMEVGLGPAKGKDFASSIGPCLVTPDELEDRRTERPGVYDLAMVARVNGEERSRGNWKDIHFSFGEMIARASADVFLLPGEILGSGAVGGGSLLELSNGEGPWLRPGDVVELEIERLGILRNVIGVGREAPAT